SRPPTDRRFTTARGLILAVVLASYVLSFFHRTAPASIAGEVTRAFGIPRAVMGTLAATYFYVYTLMQVPVGVLADAWGPRRLLTVGGLLAGIGSLTFGLAPTCEVAAVGRTLVGIGVSVAFLSALKINATWFPARSFASLNGVTLLAGNLGAVVAGAPLAWAVTVTSWRSVFAGLGVLSLAIGVASWFIVRDRPEDAGFPVVNPHAFEGGGRTGWTGALREVAANPATWPGFLVNMGVAGAFFAFAGLWAVPYLVEVHGMSQVLAGQHGSLLLLGVAVGAVLVGVLSDRLGSRVGVMRAFTVAFALSWTPWLLDVRWPLPATLAWFGLMGLLIPGFTLTWTVAKEVNRPQFSGMATAMVNVGGFLGGGILQPLIGWQLDLGRTAGQPGAAWSRALAIMAGSAALGAAFSFLVRGRVRGMLP
ncbi:MAG: MFS transporter, partial [Deltaproteobacteria bacterium]